jgi:predicted CopG family antitoxin
MIFMYSMLSSGNKRLKQIVVDEENYEALRMLGHARDSFNDVVTRLLQQNQNKLAVEVK